MCSPEIGLHEGFDRSLKDDFGDGEVTHLCSVNTVLVSQLH
jgi:hypothetical protein